MGGEKQTEASGTERLFERCGIPKSMIATLSSVHPPCLRALELSEGIMALVLVVGQGDRGRGCIMDDSNVRTLEVSMRDAAGSEVLHAACHGERNLYALRPCNANTRQLTGSKIRRKFGEVDCSRGITVYAAKFVLVREALIQRPIFSLAPDELEALVRLGLFGPSFACIL
jgi:hypothetical protein